MLQHTYQHMFEYTNKEMIEMIEQQNYIRFNKDMTTITIDDIEITIPTYVFRATKRYRFNATDKILEKQCVSCNRWFSICTIEDNSFKLINDECLIHFLGKSGAATYCRKCEKDRISDCPAPEPNPKPSMVNRKSLNIIIPDHHKKYLKCKSYLEDRNVTSIVLEILENYIKENPINVSFK